LMITTLIMSTSMSMSTSMTVNACSCILSYNANGGSGAPPCQTTSTGYLYICGTQPIRSGYSFLGWSTGCAATCASVRPGDYVYISCNTTLYSVWKNCGSGSNTGGGGSSNTGGSGSGVTDWQVTLTYDANGGTGAPPKQTFWVQSGTYISSTIPTRNGYTFVGWTVDASNIPPATGTAGYQPGNYLNRSSDFTLYAMWRSNVTTYTLSYDANGGTGAPASQTAAAGATINLSTQIPVRDGYPLGYRFLGWNPNQTATSPTYQPGQTVSMPGQNRTLYAVWMRLM